MSCNVEQLKLPYRFKLPDDDYFVTTVPYVLIAEDFVSFDATVKSIRPSPASYTQEAINSFTSGIDVSFVQYSQVTLPLVVDAISSSSSIGSTSFISYAILYADFTGDHKVSSATSVGATTFVNNLLLYDIFYIRA